MASKLPPRTLSSSTAAGLAAKYQSYVAARTPQTSGVHPNNEAVQFETAILRGFVDDSEAGLGLMLEWLSPGTQTRIDAGLYDYEAFLTHWARVPYLSAAGQARANAQWLAAVDAEYQLALPASPTPLSGGSGTGAPAVPAASVPASGFVTSPISGAVLIPRSAVLSDTVDPLTGSRILVYVDPASGRTITLTGPATNTGAQAAQPVRSLVQWVASKDPASGYGAIGDGIHFPTIGYRIGYQRPTGIYDHFGPWVRYTTFLNRTSSSLTSVVFLEDVRGEVEQALAIGDVRPRDYYDWPRFLEMLSAPQGTPPDPTIPVDVYADPGSTGARPITLPIGSRPPDRAPGATAPVPSGSIPTWTDIAAPPPPSTGTELPTDPSKAGTNVLPNRPGNAADVPSTGASSPSAAPPGATRGAGGSSAGSGAIASPGAILAVLAVILILGSALRGNHHGG